jgi:hypothetical protein
MERQRSNTILVFEIKSAPKIGWPQSLRLTRNNQTTKIHILGMFRCKNFNRNNIRSNRHHKQDFQKYFNQRKYSCSKCVCVQKGSIGCDRLRFYIYRAVYTLCPSYRKIASTVYFSTEEIWKLNESSSPVRFCRQCITYRYSLLLLDFVQLVTDI